MATKAKKTAPQAEDSNTAENTQTVTDNSGIKGAKPASQKRGDISGWIYDHVGGEVKLTSTSPLFAGQNGIVTVEDEDHASKLATQTLFKVEKIS